VVGEEGDGVEERKMKAALGTAVCIGTRHGQPICYSRSITTRESGLRVVHDQVSVPVRPLRSKATVLVIPVLPQIRAAYMGPDTNLVTMEEDNVLPLEESAKALQMDEVLRLAAEWEASN
jgi:hypothetical protein